MANEKQEKKTPEIDVDAMVDNHVQKALKALEQFMDMTQEQVDKIVEAMTVAGQENHTRLAKMAVEETGRGVYEDKIIGRGYNRRMVDHSALAHAEIAAIKKACKRMGDWRLEECELYVTLEPCPMCAGAIVQARIPKVYIGSMNPKAGCAGSVLNLLDEKRFNHQVETEEGLLGEECSMMLKEFFKELREKRKKKKEEKAGE